MQIQALKTLANLNLSNYLGMRNKRIIHRPPHCQTPWNTSTQATPPEPIDSIAPFQSASTAQKVAIRPKSYAIPSPRSDPHIEKHSAPSPSPPPSTAPPSTSAIGHCQIDLDPANCRDWLRLEQCWHFGTCH